MAWTIAPNKYSIYTDGGSRGNSSKPDEPAAWAFIVTKNGEKLGSKSDAMFGKTNNQMELTAILEALKWANKFGEQVSIHTDSQLCIDSITKWMFGWANKGWKKADGQPVKNQDILRLIYELYSPTKHKFEKVKGHSGDRFNEMVDELVNLKMDELILNSEYSPLNFH